MARLMLCVRPAPRLTVHIGGSGRLATFYCRARSRSIWAFVAGLADRRRRLRPTRRHRRMSWHARPVSFRDRWCAEPKRWSAPPCGSALRGFRGEGASNSSRSVAAAAACGEANAQLAGSANCTPPYTARLASHAIGQRPPNDRRPGRCHREPTPAVDLPTAFSITKSCPPSPRMCAPARDMHCTCHRQTHWRQHSRNTRRP